MQGWLGRSVELEGMLHPDFVPVARTLASQLRFHSGGAAVCVYHRGECVVDLWGGTRDEDGRPWQRDTMAPSFSTTKGVASTLIHIMADRGVLEYDERVARYWPEFAQEGKHDITLRHVLAHQSGLYHIRQMIDDAHRMLDWGYMVSAIERAVPLHPAGARTGYHGLTYGFLVGEILQRATGRSFSDLVREELAEPLGLDGLYVGAPADAIARAAQLIWPRRGQLLERLPRFRPTQSMQRAIRGTSSLVYSTLRLAGLELDLESMVDALAPRGIGTFDFGAHETLRASIPAGNGLFTARSLARMYAALAGRGTLEGVRLLSPTTVERIGERQTAPSRAVIPFDMRWRLGYHGIFTMRGSPRHAFGHFGFGGSGAWADPSRNLAVALIVNSGLGTPFGDTRTARISGAALSGADRRRSARTSRRRHDRPAREAAPAKGVPARPNTA